MISCAPYKSKLIVFSFRAGCHRSEVCDKLFQRRDNCSSYPTTPRVKHFVISLILSQMASEKKENVPCLLLRNEKSNFCPKPIKYSKICQKIISSFKNETVNSGKRGTNNEIYIEPEAEP